MRSHPAGWNTLLAKLGLKRRTKPARRLARGNRMACIEHLEPRQMLAGDARTYIVTTLVDDDIIETTTDELWSLREALNHSAQDGYDEYDTITFAPGILDAAHQTMRLELGDLVVDSYVNIVGPGADRLTIDAQANSRVFHVGSSASTVSGPD